MVHAQSYCWTPLVLCLLIKAIESKRPLRGGFLAGISWGLQIMAADPQTAFYTYCALVLYAFIHCGSLSSPGHFNTAMKTLAVVFIVGVGLSAVELIPALQLVRQSTRGMIKSYELITSASFPPQGLITMLMPHFFGNLPDKSFWVADIPWSLPEFNLYAGVSALLLVPFAKFFPVRTNRLTLFCLLTAILSALLAMGYHTPLYRVAYLLPGFNSFRAPSKIIVLWMLAVSLLAGKGLDDLADLQTRKRWGILFSFCFFCLTMLTMIRLKPEMIRVLFSPFLLEPITSEDFKGAIFMIQDQFTRMTILVLLSAVLWYLGYRKILRPAVWLSASLCILIADLCLNNQRYVQHYDEAYAALRLKKNELHRYFQMEDEIFRVGEMDSPFGPNTAMYYGLQSAAGGGPLILHRFYLFCDQFYKKVAPPGWAVLWYGAPDSGKHMDMLNVKYEIRYPSKKISRRKMYTPRALLVLREKFLPAAEMLDYMQRDDFNPREMVLFERHDADALKSSLPRTSERGREAGTCRILQYRPNDIQIHVLANRYAYLVLNDVYYPGWKGFVDGIETPIFRCNYLFRALPVPPGKHEVQFVFDPPLVRAGITGTAATLIVAVILFSFSPIKRFLRSTTNRKSGRFPQHLQTNLDVQKKEGAAVSPNSNHGP
jgi:hypothetical protein